MNVSAFPAALGAAVLLSLPLPVQAQSSDASKSPSEEEIRRALEADAKANQASGNARTPAGGSEQTPGSSSSALPAPVAAGARVIQSLNPDIALLGDFAVAAFSSPMTMTGGHDPSENGFNLQALELSLGANVDPYFRFDSNIVLGNEGIELEEAYGTTSALPAGLQVRAGKFLTRFGRFNPTHPHAWAFSDQPLVLGRFFGGDGNRNLGVEVSELLTFLPWYVEAVLSSTDSRGETARSFLGEPAEGQEAAKIQSPVDLQYTAALKQFFPLSDDLSLAVGLSGAFGPNASGEGQRTEIYGADVYLKYRPLGEASFTIVSLHLEGLLRRYGTPDQAFVDSGAFAHLFWRFEPRWGAGLSAEYVATPEGHPLDADGAGLRQRYKANVTFWPTEFSRLRLQYDFEPPGQTTPAAHALFLAAEFAIGAHGAHKF